VAPVKYSNPLPGDFGLVRISGAVGEAISIGQTLVGSGSYYTHAFVVTNDMRVVQAEVGGAQLVTLDEATNGYARVAYSAFDLTDKQRRIIANTAAASVGTPYSFLDYLAIAALRIAHTDRLERFVGRTKHMICSQLVAQCYANAGYPLFPMRAPGDVAPGDLAHLIGAV
jgi:uncharacterized protein YycO